MRKKVLIAIVLVLVFAVSLIGCEYNGIPSYKIPLIDLDEKVVKTGGVGGETDIDYVIGDKTLADAKYSYMFRQGDIVADISDYGKDYMAHPDSILVRRRDAKNNFAFGNDVLTIFSNGDKGIAGKFGIVNTDNKDTENYGVITYGEKLTTPTDWNNAANAPTLNRLVFNDNNKSDNNDALIMVYGSKDNGFNVSLSVPNELTEAEGRDWTECETWYGKKATTLDAEGNGVERIRKPQGDLVGAYEAQYAMSSLTRLKDPKTHKWTNSWMGLFHDSFVNCYKTILTFEDAPADNKYPTYNIGGKANQIMVWSKPDKYFDNDDNHYRGVQRKSDMCDVEVIRSEAGEGNELALITRSNSKKMNSLISTSTDEGKTWSAPRELPYALSGERHKAEWVKVKGEDKLFITFRSIERSKEKADKFGAGSSWMSEGWVAWVGSWDDLVNKKANDKAPDREGDFRVKLAHTYLDKQAGPSRSANPDTGYAGNVVIKDPTGKNDIVVTCSYGRFESEASIRQKQTYIISKTVNVSGLYDIIDLMNKAKAEAEANKDKETK